MSGSGLRTSRSEVRYDRLTGISFERLDSPVTIEMEKINGATLSFHDINYELNIATTIRSKLPFCKLKEKKLILSKVSGTFQQGMNAILGPTGCGKSTLLDILADRKIRSSYKGQVLMNHRLRPSSLAYRYMIGYVVQDDIYNYSGTLTVRENIMFSANLRLPQSVLLNE